MCRDEERERASERERIFYLLVQSPNGHNGQNSLKSGTSSEYSTCIQGPTLWTVSSCFPTSVSRELELKCDSWERYGMPALQAVPLCTVS